MAARLTGVLLALALGAPAVAQTGPSEPSAALPNVTVIAPRLQQVPDLVERFGAPDAKGRLARWKHPVCPVVRGLSQNFDRMIEDRIRETASAAKIVAANARCAANIVILITPQPDKLATSLVERHRSILAGNDRWPFNRVKAQAFVDSTEPVRWWYISDSVATLGGKAFSSAAPSQTASFAYTNLLGPPVYGNVVPSHLTPATEEAFSRAIIVVDARRLVGFDLAQISGYLSMVSLAQLHSNADLEGVDSIMGMFDAREEGRSPAPDLTFWDRAYLTALYDTDAQVDFSLQKGNIATHVRHDVAVRQVIPLSATQAGPSGG